MSGLSAVLGPVVAGLLIDADVLGTGWRSIFLVNLPVGAFVVLAGARYLPSVAPTTTSRRLDGSGMGLAAAGTFLLIYPLVQGHELGWPTWTLAMLAASVPVLVAFGFILALLYEKTGSIWPGILLHMLNNSVALLGQ